jgi:hypothetical protein
MYVRIFEHLRDGKSNGIPGFRHQRAYDSSVSTATIVPQAVSGTAEAVSCLPYEVRNSPVCPRQGASQPSFPVAFDRGLSRWCAGAGAVRHGVMSQGSEPARIAR